MNPTRIRLGGPSDVLAVLPYQLGFHPTRVARRRQPARHPHGPGAAHRPAAARAHRRSGRGDAAPVAAGRAGRGPAARASSGPRATACRWSPPWPTPATRQAWASATGSSSGTGGGSRCTARMRPAVRSGAGPCRGRTRCLPSPSSSAARSALWRTGRRSRTACVRPPRRPPTPSTPVPRVAADPTGAHEDTAAAFHDLRRRELRTWATVLRCRDEDGPLRRCRPPRSWPGWPSP